MSTSTALAEVSLGLQVCTILQHVDVGVAESCDSAFEVTAQALVEALGGIGVADWLGSQSNLGS